jgi:hypothetical protein
MRVRDGSSLIDPIVIMRILTLTLALGLVAGCTSSRTVGQPNLSVRNDSIRLARRDKVDILFMIDNSVSMGPKQAALNANFPELVTRIQTLATSGAPASFHIGVVDSDLGAGPSTSIPGCQPDGHGGKLHTAADPTAQNLPAACAAFQLDPMESFINYDSGTGVSNVTGVDLGTAFTCLSAVGERGCGFEHQLESVYRALTDPTINTGFLRTDALLVVVWLTDEDDCSAPADSPLFDPSSAGIAQYGVLQSFRCTQFGITCDGKPLTGAALSSNNCAPVTGGPLFDVKRYADLFTAPRAAGGLKDGSSDVLLVSLAAPPSPVIVETTQPCSGQPSAPSCAELAHSCVAAGSPAFFGDPAVRIHAVMASTVNGIEAPICVTDYTSTLDVMADVMGARMRTGCLPGAVVDRGDPGCVVTINGADTPRCSTGRLPCWDLTDDMGCPARPTPAGATQQLRFMTEGAPSDASIVATCPLYEPAT